jgi:hypothetical protein
MFCIYCGAPNPANASFCSTCGKAVAVARSQTPAGVAAQKQVPELEKATTQFAGASPAPMHTLPNPANAQSHVLRNVVLIAGVILAVIVAAVLLSGPTPKDSLERAGNAFARQDAQAFDNYVDMQSILGDWTDQAATSWLANNKGSAGDTLIANGLVAGFKSLIVPKLATSVEQEILSSAASDRGKSNEAANASDYMTDFLSSRIHDLLASQLTYQGVASQTESGPDAVLDVRVGSPIKTSALMVQVKMRRVGDHWRIVAIPDVAGLLAQLHSSP